MSANNCYITLVWTGVVNRDVLLNGKSKLVFMSGYDSARLLSDILTSGYMLNNAKMRHVSRG